MYQSTHALHFCSPRDIPIKRYMKQGICCKPHYGKDCKSNRFLWCPFRRDMDKFEQTGLIKGEAKKINAPVIEDSPVNIECRVREEVALGSHTMFIADVVHVTVDDSYMDERGTFHLEKAAPIVYSHGTYFGLGESLGTFGYSVRKKKKEKNR